MSKVGAMSVTKSLQQLHTSTTVHVVLHAGSRFDLLNVGRFLNENVAFDVSAMLANDGGRMENVASWADKIKHQAGWGWTSPLHHVNVDLICPKGRCLTAAIANYSSRLLSRTDPESSYIDLKFLVHYLGDINQVRERLGATVHSRTTQRVIVLAASHLNAQQPWRKQ